MAKMTFEQLVEEISGIEGFCCDAALAAELAQLFGHDDGTEHDFEVERKVVTEIELGGRKVPRTFHDGREVNTIRTLFKMDNGMREELHAALCGTDNDQAFLDAYCYLHWLRTGTEFIPAYESIYR